MLKIIFSSCISDSIVLKGKIFSFVSLFFFIFELALAQTITYDNWEKFTIPNQMPSGVHLQDSNNNLDLIQFKNRFYVAFRTAPTHFASSKTVMYVVSSSDCKKWEYEYELNIQADIREPRFAIWNDSLYLYCFKGGTKKFKFEPKKLLVTNTSEGKYWAAIESVQLDGYVPWRLRVHNNELWLSAYYGKDLYNNKHQSDLRLFKSKDARHFIPISKEPQINVKTAEEGEFIFDSTGTLYAVVRLEGYGALVCKADKDSLDKWHYVKTKHKYDSSLLFEHKNEIYLIARRNVDGPCDRSAEGHKPHRAYNLVRYSVTKKRTALYKLDKAKLSFAAVLDFPSTGDCSFAGIQKLNDSDYLVMNYSNEISGKEKIWLIGQFGKTYLYQSILHFK